MITLRPFRTIFSSIRSSSLLVVAILMALGGYSIVDINAHSAGITGETQKTTNEGCHCHCTTSSSSTTVSLTTGSGSSPLTAAPSTTYTFTATVANSGENDGGIDISSYSGNGLSPGTGLQNGVSPQTSELTHTSPKAFSGGSTSWTFTYTTGSTNAWDTLYASGNAVNGDGMSDGDCSDKWNWAPKFIIHTVVPAKRIALGRSSISFGQLRVGHRIADSLLVTSDGDAAITISSSGMKSGAHFSSFPTSTNRTLNAGSTEMDSAIFTPTSRGTFNDSLIFTTNSDTVPQQHIGTYVSGQGIQGVFSSTNGTTVAFGNVRVGRTPQLTFNFSNSGDDTLFLSAPSISGTGFSIVSGGSSATLAPNQTGSVGVKFAPTAKQPYSGTLSFTEANGVSTPSVTISGTGTLPQVQVSTNQNIGSIRVGLTLQGTVTLQNVGTDTLHISSARLTQPGSLFTLGAYDQAVAPGASGTVHIAYLPDSERTDSATLHFTTDDPSDTAVSIVVTGSGLLPHMAVTENHDTVDLGQVKVNSSVTQQIAVANNGATDLDLTNVTAGPAPFSLGQSPNVVSAETIADVGVIFAPTTTGTFFGMLVINGNDPANPSDTVYLTGTGINSALTIKPASLNFGQVPVSTTLTDTITLQNTGSASLNIKRYQLTQASNAFAIVDSSSHQVGAAASSLVIVSFHPDSALSYSGVLTLTTDDASTPTRTINLSGLGVKGALTIIPASINFGSVPIGHDSSIHVSLRNTGQASVTISTIKMTGTGASAFSDGSFFTPVTITAGDSTSLNLTFTPAAAQTYQGIAQLTLGDGTSLGIALQGVGTSAGVSLDEAGPSGLSLSVSPNPASNSVTVHVTVSQPSETRLEIFDATGKMFIERTLGVLSVGSHDVSVPVSNLLSGSYFVRVSNGNGERANERMVIER